MEIFRYDVEVIPKSVLAFEFLICVLRNWACLPPPDSVFIGLIVASPSVLFAYAARCAHARVVYLPRCTGLACSLPADLPTVAFGTARRRGSMPHALHLVCISRAELAKHACTPHRRRAQLRVQKFGHCSEVWAFGSLGSLGVAMRAACHAVSLQFSRAELAKHAHHTCTKLNLGMMQRGCT